MSETYGTRVGASRTVFRVRAPLAEALDLCLFDNDTETRHAMAREGDDWTAAIPADLTGARYGYRACGPYNPAANLWFDPAKLLVDPHAVELDTRFVQHPALSEHGADTAAIVPKTLVIGPLPDVTPAPPQFTHGQLVYELNVRSFTLLHPGVPEAKRGTVAALAHPAIVAHLKSLNVGAVELMPIIAWIDERHLPPLGLTNTWGYNPVAPMALDPGLCPGGVAELRETVAALHAEGIGVILDIVLNHTGESDAEGGTLCLRGLDPQAFARNPDGTLANIAGTGNTLDFGYEPMRRLALDTLRHFVRHCGVDGFRFDLAPVLARGPDFAPDAPIFGEIAADPWLADRVMIAEPWDIGWGGYQLGNFPDTWLEWNDRYRDDVRRFWRGDGGVGTLATRMAGSSDIFGARTRSVNFLAAHDGFTLADTVAYEQRHNHANGEDNRDGHGENFSWNNGVEGPTGDPQVEARRSADLRALLGTLFASTGTIMLTAGDEFGRSQGGNNNAYCQDTPIDWAARDRDLECYVQSLAAQRAALGERVARFPEEGTWVSLGGKEMTEALWNAPDTSGFRYVSREGSSEWGFRVDRLQRSAGPVTPWSP